jgi:hypothetical protein
MSSMDCEALKHKKIQEGGRKRRKKERCTCFVYEEENNEGEANRNIVSARNSSSHRCEEWT